MKLKKYRPILIIVAAMMFIAACSGPDASFSQTPIADDVALAPPQTSAETQSPAGDDPITDPSPTAEGVAGDGLATPSQGQVEPTPAPGETPTIEPPLPPPPTAFPSPAIDSNLPEGVLPGHRILAYYGHPSTPNMGILGEYSKEDLLARLREEAASYEAADPSKPVKLAFELIATVAQPVPGDDGTYVLYTGDEWIGEYVEFTAANDMILILDLQIGHSTIRDEIERIRHWLEYPHVHVALDPEFSTGPDRIPGEFIGEVDGNHVQIAVELLSQIALENNLPPKILTVHQFEHEMIYNKEAIKPMPGVDIVIDMDGFGSPEAKIGNYNVFVGQEFIEYGGIKLFYKQDAPLITPAEIVSLQPPPALVIYQ